MAYSSARNYGTVWACPTAIFHKKRAETGAFELSLVDWG